MTDYVPIYEDAEGSLVMATSLVIAQNVAFMVKHGSGILSVGMKCEDLERLKIPLMSPENEDDVSAPSFTVSVGVLLYGPPGTGKTLLARAVAHHTDCTFIRVSASELVQKYIGEGSRMVRELFVMASYTNQDAEAELDTEKAYKQIDKLKRKHERDISAWKQLIAESRLPKEAIEPVYDDRNTTKYDGVEPETTTLERRV
ncbi:hypothetical protein POM88_017417 [Heracleum sosnowskyi]|uniref:ATPase AAA-type core domain-containing protein n=1 Tax=Heracleum sosnowskyi TaxID=360622 RepID=A0AAD8MXX9_9APIA|nr:hypothetical protein POM88_017417 [Heracleum sosnowskyi]